MLVKLIETIQDAVELIDSLNEKCHFFGEGFLSWEKTPYGAYVDCTVRVEKNMGLLFIIEAGKRSRTTAIDAAKKMFPHKEQINNRIKILLAGAMPE